MNQNKICRNVTQCELSTKMNTTVELYKSLALIIIFIINIGYFPKLLFLGPLFFGSLILSVFLDPYFALLYGLFTISFKQISILLFQEQIYTILFLKFLKSYGNFCKIERGTLQTSKKTRKETQHFSVSLKCKYEICQCINFVKWWLISIEIFSFLNWNLKK